MTLARHTLTSAARIAAVIALLHCGPVRAGPAEDYAEGIKRHSAGDLTGAMPLLRRAADAGHAAAQALTAQIADQADSDEEAVEYFRKSALQGNADGQFGLGIMLATGEGVPTDLIEGGKWIALAAEQGHKMAVIELATAYINGGLGIPESERHGPAAQRWIRAAAEHGYLPAMEKLAIAYRGGELGLSADAKEADQWAEKVRKIRNVPKARRNRKG